MLFTRLRGVPPSPWCSPVYVVFPRLRGVPPSTWCFPVYVLYFYEVYVYVVFTCLPVYVVLEQLPVLALGVGRVKGDTDALMDGRGDLEGIGP